MSTTHQDRLSLPPLPLFTQVGGHARVSPSHIAIIDVAAGTEFTYNQLLTDVAAAKEALLELVGLPADGDLQEQVVAMVIPKGYAYVVTQWAIWAAGGICVPLCRAHPIPELLRAIQSTDPCLIAICRGSEPVETTLKTSLPTRRFTEIDGYRPDKRHLEGKTPTQILQDQALHWRSRRALIIFTSGTTSQPKGCVLTHDNITAQAANLTGLWELTPADHFIHISPLHHVSGLINGLLAGLWAGMTIEMHPKFNPAVIWARWQLPHTSSLFSGVPTVYISLLEFYNAHIRGDTVREKTARDGVRSLRLLTCAAGSLPTSARAALQNIMGQPILEEYGSTETGMALSNGLAVERRIPGTMGWPVPGVQLRLVDDSGVIITEPNTRGELQVKGGNVFVEYWRQPESTIRAFTEDGWFRTGDVAQRDDNGAYYVWGRADTDWIKSGGYGISALEVEQHCLSVEGVQEVVVLGVADEKWGQRVAAVVRQCPGATPLQLSALRAHLKRQIATYKVPTLLTIVDQIDRNAMGKVNKKVIARALFPDRMNG